MTITSIVPIVKLTSKVVSYPDPPDVMFIAYSINTRSVYTVSDKHLRHGGSGYETTSKAC